MYVCMYVCTVRATSFIHPTVESPRWKTHGDPPCPRSSTECVISEYTELPRSASPCGTAAGLTHKVQMRLKQPTIFLHFSSWYINNVFQNDQTIPTIPNTIYLFLQKTDFQHLHFNVYCLQPRGKTEGQIYNVQAKMKNNFLRSFSML